MGDNFNFGRVLVYSGWVLMLVSVIMTLGTILGLVTIEYFSINGSSVIRSIAAVAIAGCLMAALGFMKEE